MALAINISRAELLNGLANQLSITSKKGTIAILSNVLIVSDSDNIIITGTDLEVGIKNIVPAEIISSGSITLPCRKLFEIIRESNAEKIILEEKENSWVKITAGVCDYNLAGIPSDEFPSFPEYELENIVKFPTTLFRDLIDKTIFAVAQEGETQFNLSGILFETEEEDQKKYIKMVSSDGHRLSLIKKETDRDIVKLKIGKKILIPKKGVQEIRKLCDTNEEIGIGFSEKQAVIKTKKSIMIIRLMNGDFPDYNNIINIDDENNYIDIDRILFLNSMKRMNIFTEDRFNVVKINIGKNNITLSSQHADIGNAKDEIPIKYSGEPFSLFFNGRYFIDVLTVLENKKIKMHIKSEKSPCFIKAEEEKGFLSVIMPMKI